MFGDEATRIGLVARHRIAKPAQSALQRLQEGGVLIVDETADAKAGEGSAGVGRQYNGRLGKVDLCQVAPCLSFVHPASGVWTLVDDELFLPEHWFSPEYAELRQAVGVPAPRTFQTKPELALAMIQQWSPRAVFLDLAAGDLVNTEAILAYRLQAPQTPFIAFGSHVDTVALAAARDAGCDPVLPRSKFTVELPHLIRSYLGETPSPS